MVQVHGLQVNPELHRFLTDEALPGSGVSADQFWSGFSRLVVAMSQRNRDLLTRRNQLQSQLDVWHRQHPGEVGDLHEYREFLEDIGYLRPKRADHEIRTIDVDTEISDIAGPQLIVPASNARYTLNAANARWGSLYDALYGTDALGLAPISGAYDPERGARVIGWVREFFDSVIPLHVGSHCDVVEYSIRDGLLQAALADGRTSELLNPEVLIGYKGAPSTPESILVRHNGLAIEIVIDRASDVGSVDLAGVSDVVIEAAVSVIVDCEDSVAAVDAADKVGVYRTWLGLMKTDLSETFTKSGERITRSLAGDREFTAPERRSASTTRTLPSDGTQRRPSDDHGCRP